MNAPTALISLKIAPSILIWKSCANPTWSMIFLSSGHGQNAAQMKQTETCSEIGRNALQEPRHCAPQGGEITTRGKGEGGGSPDIPTVDVPAYTARCNVVGNSRSAISETTTKRATSGPTAARLPAGRQNPVLHGVNPQGPGPHKRREKRGKKRQGKCNRGSVTLRKNSDDFAAILVRIQHATFSRPTEIFNSNWGFLPQRI